MGNRPGATGFLDTSLFPTYNTAELTDYQQRGEIGYTTHKGQLARVFIQAHPRHFLLMSGQRLARFWTGSGTRPGSALFSFHATLSLFLGSCGLCLLWRDERKELCLSLLIPLVLFPLPYYVTHAEFRCRLVLDPLLTTLSATTLSYFLLCVRSVRHNTVAIAEASSLLV